MAKRQVFFSFHYDNDNWRVAQVRNMRKVDDNSTFSDNDWEEVKLKSEDNIKKWIDDQLKMRSCIVVLIGFHTFQRKWVIYEIKRAYELKKGIVGIYIHNLKNNNEEPSKRGGNPFNKVWIDENTRLSKYVTAYESPFTHSKRVYADIEEKIEGLIEDAISKAGTY